MALVNCPKCGKMVSDQAKQCPHCGADLTKKPPFLCKECGAKIPEGASACPNCGWPVPNEREEDSEPLRWPEESVTKSPRDNRDGEKLKKLLVDGALCVIAVIAVFAGVTRMRERKREAVQTQNTSQVESIQRTEHNTITPTPEARTKSTAEKVTVTETPKANKESATATANNSSFTLKHSNDKHIAYIDNYVGKNAASVGYSSLAGDRRVEVGADNMLVEFVTSDGSYVGASDEDALKDYIVTAQSIAPNTEVHLEFQKKEDGTEYDNLTSFASYDKIDLAVKKVGADGNGPVLTPEKPSPDKYTCYIRNYVGKNLASVGYQSLGGEYRDAYGAGSVRLDLVS